MGRVSTSKTITAALCPHSRHLSKLFSLLRLSFVSRVFGPGVGVLALSVEHCSLYWFPSRRVPPQWLLSLRLSLLRALFSLPTDTCWTSSFTETIKIYVSSLRMAAIRDVCSSSSILITASR